MFFTPLTPQTIHILFKENKQGQFYQSTFDTLNRLHSVHTCIHLRDDDMLAGNLQLTLAYSALLFILLSLFHSLYIHFASRGGEFCNRVVQRNFFVRFIHFFSAPTQMINVLLDLGKNILKHLKID